jgi:hypothetical protein
LPFFRRFGQRLSAGFSLKMIENFLDLPENSRYNQPDNSGYRNPQEQ